MTLEVTPRRLCVGIVLASLLPGCGGTPRPVHIPKAAQQPVERGPLVFATAEILLEFEGDTDAIYRLGPGDRLQVVVWRRPELSGSHTVGSDGRISLPLTQSLKVAQLTREEAAGVVQQALAPYYLDLQVSVQVETFVSNEIYVLGRIDEPGVIEFHRRPRLIEVLARINALPVSGMGAELAALSRLAIIRGKDRILWIDLKELLSGRDPSLNVMLQRGDTVYIPDGDDQLMYVLGEVESPGAFLVTPDMTLLDAIARAGGLSEDAAKRQIRFVRPRTGLEVSLPLEQLLTDPKANLMLEEGDVVYLPRRGVADFGYTLQQLTAGGLALLLLSSTGGK